MLPSRARVLAEADETVADNTPAWEADALDSNSVAARP